MPTFHQTVLDSRARHIWVDIQTDIQAAALRHFGTYRSPSPIEDTPRENCFTQNSGRLQSVCAQRGDTLERCLPPPATVIYCLAQTAPHIVVLSYSTCTSSSKYPGSASELLKGCRWSIKSLLCLMRCMLAAEQATRKSVINSSAICHVRNNNMRLERWSQLFTVPPRLSSHESALSSVKRVPIQYTRSPY